MEREKLECDELLTRSADDRASLDQSLRRLEDDSTELNRQLHVVQAQLADAQHEHNNRYV